MQRAFSEALYFGPRKETCRSFNKILQYLDEETDLEKVAS